MCVGTWDMAIQTLKFLRRTWLHKKGQSLAHHFEQCINHPYQKLCIKYHILICIYIYTRIYLHIYIYIYVSIYLSIYIYICIYLSNMYIYIFIIMYSVYIYIYVLQPLTLWETDIRRFTSKRLIKPYTKPVPQLSTNPPTWWTFYSSPPVLGRSERQTLGSCAAAAGTSLGIVWAAVGGPGDTVGCMAIQAIQMCTLHEPSYHAINHHKSPQQQPWMS